MLLVNRVLVVTALVVALAALFGTRAVPVHAEETERCVNLEGIFGYCLPPIEP